MTMTSFLHNRGGLGGRRGRSIKITLGLLALLLILTFAGTGVQRLGAGVATGLARPFWRASAGTANIWRNFSAVWKEKKQLVLENQDLQSKLESASLLASEAEHLRQENEDLRTALGRKQASPTPMMLARSLGAAYRGPFDLLTLDLGRNNSALALKIGDRVTVLGNVWLGSIVQVSSGSSRVRLLTHAGLSTPALLGEDRTPILLVGRGGGNFLATVPRGLMIKAGEPVIVPDLSRDWLVAVVGAVESQENKTEQVLYLRAPLEASRLKYVTVLSE